MSSYHPSKGLVNRYWKRPKPRIYECNIRDAERFYKESYNQYLQSKHFSASHGTKPTDIEEQFATKWTLDRMNSRLDSQFEPSMRETSITGCSGDYGTNMEEAGGRSSKVTFSRHDSLTENNNDYRTPYRARSLVAPARESSPDFQQDNIESRLDRIKRLREELGMNVDGTVEDSRNSASGRSILKRSSNHEVPSETRAFKSDVSQNSYSNSVSSSSRNRGIEPSTDHYESKYSQKSERSARTGRNEDNNNSFSSFNNKSEKASRSYMTDDIDQYSTRSKRTDSKYPSDDQYSTRSKYTDSKYPSDDQYSTRSKYTDSKYPSDDQYSTRSKHTDSKYPSDEKYSSSYRSKGNKLSEEDTAYESKYSRPAKKSSASANLNGEEYANVDEDDELVSKIKKKFPTSDEILERIKRLDDDL